MQKLYAKFRKSHEKLVKTLIRKFVNISQFKVTPSF